MLQFNTQRGTIATGIGLIAAEPRNFDAIGSLLSQCGLSLWPAASVIAYVNDARRNRSLCVVIAMQGRDGLETLEALRAIGIRAPAILIADENQVFPPDRLAHACALDVLTGQAYGPELLAWIECICTARMVLERQRAA